MKNLIITLGSLSAGLALTACSEKQSTSTVEHPNIIYVFPDQYRNMAMGFWDEPAFEEARIKADPVHTPNLDKFAKESLVLSSAMSNCPLSSPHRGSLMTGMYPNKSGIPLNCNTNRPISSLRTDVTCMSDVFSQNGYDCAYFGKLHADHPTPNDPNNPGHYVDDSKVVWDAYTPKERRHGFNYWYSYGTFDVHKNPHYWDTEGKKHEPKEWSPIHEAKQVVKYLRNQENQRDAKKPFFLMLGMNPPHSPYRSLDDCMEEDYNLYKDMPIDSLLVRPNADRKRDKANSAKFYFASVTGVDRAFGMILETLKELGLDKNTIVVFTSDHGETMCSQYMDEPKNQPYAESMNVPFIVRYPGHIRPRLDNLMLSSPDIMPTMLGLANLQNDIPQTVQGTNLADFMYEAETSTTRPTSALYIRNVDGEKDANGKVISYFPVSRGLKTHHYTLALFIDRDKKLKSTLLFDDLKDPYQLNNLSFSEHPEIVKELLTEMGKKLKDIDDPWYKEHILSDMISYAE